MKKTATLCAASLLFSVPAHALTLEVTGIKNGKRIPDNFAFCVPDGKGRTKNGGNFNPQVRWGDLPKGTKSLALVMVDPDVPAKFDNANKEGKTIPANYPRQDFYHWVVVNIPTTLSSIRQGQDSSGHTEGGKKPGTGSYGTTGRNSYATFMKGTFGGYDGPCPPWNDQRVHNYHFKLFALDTDGMMGLKDNFTGKDALRAISEHMLESAEVVGTFSNLPDAK